MLLTRRRTGCWAGQTSTHMSTWKCQKANNSVADQDGEVELRVSGFKVRVNQTAWEKTETKGA